MEEKAREEGGPNHVDVLGSILSNLVSLGLLYLCITKQLSPEMTAVGLLGIISIWVAQIPFLRK